MKHRDTARVQNYLRQRFGNKRLSLRAARTRMIRPT